MNLMQLIRSQSRYPPLRLNFLRIGALCDFYSTDFGHFLDDEKQPTKPKKPCGAFFMFLKDIKPQLRKEHSQAREKDITKLASEMWRNGDSNVRTKYMDTYYKNMEEYKKAFQQYRSSLPSDSIEPEEPEKSVKATFKKKMKDLGRPKKPPAAYAIFFSTRTGSKKKSENRSEWMRKIGEEWKNMPEKQKEKYIAKAQELEQAYNDNLRSWLREILEHDSPEYKPMQDMVLKTVKREFLNIKRRNRQELVQKPLEPKLKEEDKLIIDMIQLFEK